MAGRFSDDQVRCSFCHKTQDQVHKLIAGPDGVYICDECVDICAEIIEEKIDVKKEIDSLLSAKKMEHTFMSLMPAGIILYMRLTSPGFLDVLYHNIAGVCIMTICLILYLTAFFFGRRMVQIEI